MNQRTLRARLPLIIGAITVSLAAGAQAPALGNVSHKGWPQIDSRGHWVSSANGRVNHGTKGNDEILGGDGNDAIFGGPGDDVLWGDSNPGGQPSSQHDILSGGPGNDWLYTSHGYNVVSGGPGKDFVWAYYGHGTIDCGPGDDTIRVRMNGAYSITGCEHVLHFCTWGDNGHGGCLKPGEKGARRQPGLG